MAESENNAQVKVLFAVTKKSGGDRLLVPSLDGYKRGYQTDGIYVEKDGEARIFSVSEETKPFGINSQDLPEGDKNYGRLSQSIGGMDGEESTQTLIDIYNLCDGTACKDSQSFGWLPSAGEFDLALADKDSFNAACEAAGGAGIADGRYWMSQRRNANYAWFYDAEGKGYGSWLGGLNEIKVRYVKGAEGYEETGAE